jgi:HAT (Half-A-TPR) repeat
VPAARQVFERWMQWQPDVQGWLSYIKFELRYVCNLLSDLLFSPCFTH